jgi:methanogenic corrinoid protein MtbC1
MNNRRDVLLERFFNALISGGRADARAIVEELIDADCPPQKIMSHLFWPTLEQIQKLYRADQLTELAHHYATRLLRMLADQMQMRLTRAESNGKRVMVVCGPAEPEELSAQMTADLLEADGYEVFFAGGGVANDEIVDQLGSINADILCVFGATPSIVPFTRLLIDHLHETGACPKLQIAVGGGVFNRAEGLAEEIGADVWAADPVEMVELLNENPDQRMGEDQRTVGRKRRAPKPAARIADAA